ncbi:MAE_28990/MAE_18760 family HEPN-like nuclease, partial [Phocaeicola dorei]
QIESIWNIFGISAPVVNEDKMKGRLSTLANHRNAIAHGRELASVIGGRYTISEIENIYNDISTYCSYITSVFEEYINNEDCLIH